MRTAQNFLGRLARRDVLHSPTQNQIATLILEHRPLIQPMNRAIFVNHTKLILAVLDTFLPLSPLQEIGSNMGNPFSIVRMEAVDKAIVSSLSMRFLS
jgi:hypothetical protein